MRSRMNEMIRTLVAAALAAVAIGTGLSVLAAPLQTATLTGREGPKVDVLIWNPVKQKMQAGRPLTALRIDSSDPKNYCSVASKAGTDFTWTDMVSSGLEYGGLLGGVWDMWAAPCPTAVASVRGAEIFYSKKVNFLNKAYFRAPDLQAEALSHKEMQQATDGGAMVVMINVDDLEQAEQVVQRAYYPPVGARSLGPGQFGNVYPGIDYVGTYNNNVVVVAIISTVQGVSEVNGIASLPGIHALYEDTMNLESDSGYAQGSPDYTRLDQAIQFAALQNQKYLCVANRKLTPNVLTCVPPSDLTAPQ